MITTMEILRAVAINIAHNNEVALVYYKILEAKIQFNVTLGRNTL